MICPVCKEEMPLLSNICKVCGYVHQDENSVQKSARDYAAIIEENIYKAKQLPMPTFMGSVMRFLSIIFPTLMLISVVLFLISNAGLFVIFSGLFLLLSVTTWLRNRKKGSSANEIKEIRNLLDLEANSMEREYGKSKEIREWLREKSGEFNAIESQHDSLNRRNLSIWCIVIIGAFLLFSGGIYGVSERVDNVENQVDQSDATSHIEEGSKAESSVSSTSATAEWKVAKEEFIASNDESDNDAKIAVLNKMLSAGEYDEAEKFFQTYSMGKVGDFSCAKVIVDHYNLINNADRRVSFISKTKLRYGSDNRKLNNL